MNILGISAYYHDSAAALLRDETIVAAAEEERFTRQKHDHNFPKNAVEYCLRAGGIDLSEVDHVVFYEKPFLTFDRILETFLAYAPRGLRQFVAAMPIWLTEKIHQKKNLIDGLSDIDPRFDGRRLLFAEHHQSHAASAFYPSPFEESLILTMDGVGEWSTTTLARGRGHTIEKLREISFPHSLGLLYSAFTNYLGFKVNSGEYKVMGLAPYGEPRFKQKILDELIHVKPDGSFRLEMKYFSYCTGLKMINARFARLFGVEPRRPESALSQEHMDIAASIQAVVDEVVSRIARWAVDTFKLRKLCLSGGVALNCVANGKLLASGVVDELWVQPAASDAGSALGAAYAVYHQHLGRPRTVERGRDRMAGSYLGPAFSAEEIESSLRAADARFEVLDDAALVARADAALREQKILGWFQGRMEFGPRALGSRSILADPRSPKMQKHLNLKIKYRESFRPFAPAVLEEDAAEWFTLEKESPYMLLVADVRAEHRRQTDGAALARGLDKLQVERSTIPAVTHVDHSARVQTVSAETNPRFHQLLSSFKQATGCPVLVNTSFNVRGEPIVCTPTDALRCFMHTEMDALAVGNFFLEKQAQDPALKTRLAPVAAQAD